MILGNMFKHEKILISFTVTWRMKWESLGKLQFVLLN
jgi:hypothetical protein